MCYNIQMWEHLYSVLESLSSSQEPVGHRRGFSSAVICSHCWNEDMCSLSLLQRHLEMLQLVNSPPASLNTSFSLCPPPPPRPMEGVSCLVNLEAETTAQANPLPFFWEICLFLVPSPSQFKGLAPEKGAWYFLELNSRSFSSLRNRIPDVNAHGRESCCAMAPPCLGTEWSTSDHFWMNTTCQARCWKGSKTYLQEGVTWM